MAFDWNNASQYGLLGGFLPGNQDPSSAASPYFEQIPGAVSPYLKPYSDAGAGAIPTLQGQYSSLLNDPSGMVDKIGAGYKQSPGFKYALQQALAGSDRAAAAGGYTGLPQHSAESMEAAEGLASKDFNSYLQAVLGQYNHGLEGEQGLYSGGVSSSNAMAQAIAQALATQGSLAFRGAEDKNAQQNNFMGGLSNLAAFL
jgi:hypothetical protein